VRVPATERTADVTATIDLEHLLKTRLVVARLGEMDMWGWWNTRGQLGPIGAAALRRGFPRTHRFAAARSVFAVAAHRCREVFDPPACVTLWSLPEDLEERFDARWEQWLDNSAEWEPFFLALEKPTSRDLAELLAERELVSDAEVSEFSRMKRSAEGRAVPVGGAFTSTNRDIALLGLAFGRGEEKALAVPYMRRNEA
jgi:hypothetical protein